MQNQVSESANKAENALSRLSKYGKVWLIPVQVKDIMSYCNFPDG
jgi:hypothetical protein